MDGAEVPKYILGTVKADHDAWETEKALLTDAIARFWTQVGTDYPSGALTFDYSPPPSGSVTVFTCELDLFHKWQAWCQES